MLFEFISAIGILLLLLIFYFGYSGLFHKIIIKVGAPPNSSGLFFYKFYRQDYKNSGAAFRELRKVPVKDKVLVGIYYDKPGKVNSDKLRSAIGVLLPETKASHDELKKTMTDVGFAHIHLPRIKKAVVVEFPHTTMFSPLIGVFRVYPKIERFIMENHLVAAPALEICQSSKIYFVFPLEERERFNVHECNPK